MVALVVVLSVVWALVGLISVATITTGSSGGLLRTGILALASWRSVIFVVGFPVLVAGEVVLLRRLGRRLGWGRESLLLMVWTLALVTLVLLAFALWGLAALAMFRMSWGLLVPLSFFYMAYGMGRRVGTEPHCAKCGYPWHEQIGSICPECGSDWSAKGGTRIGRPERSLVFVAVGVVLLFFSFAGTATPLMRGPLNKLVPTSYLIDEIVSKGVGWVPPWTEINARTLTPEQTLRLADGLLDLRLRHGHLYRLASTWLEGQVSSGSLPPELVERFYVEMFELELRSRVMPDGLVRVELTGINRTTPMAGTEVRIIFGGLKVDGELVEGTRFEEFASVYRFDPWAVARKPGDSLPGVVVTGKADSVTVVTAEAWLCYGAAAQLPWGDAWGGAWGMPDSPAIPTGLPWVRHVKLRVEIEAGD